MVLTGSGWPLGIFENFGPKAPFLVLVADRTGNRGPMTDWFWSVDPWTDRSLWIILNAIHSNLWNPINCIVNWIFNSIDIFVCSNGHSFKDGLTWIYRFVGPVYRTGNGISISVWISCSQLWNCPIFAAAKFTVISICLSKGRIMQLITKISVIMINWEFSKISSYDFYPIIKKSKNFCWNTRYYWLNRSLATLKLTGQSLDCHFISFAKITFLKCVHKSARFWNFRKKILKFYFSNYQQKNFEKMFP